MLISLLFVVLFPAQKRLHEFSCFVYWLFIIASQDLSHLIAVLEYPFFEQFLGTIYSVVLDVLFM